MSRTEEFLDNYERYKPPQPTTTRGGAEPDQNTPLRALAIDGGGVRGLIPARVLERVEALTEKPIWESFDLISGTSTGGLIALALSAPDPKDNSKARWTPREMAELYLDAGKTIFPQGFLHLPFKQVLFDKYSAGSLERELHARLDPSTVSEAKTDVVVTSWNLTNNAPAYFNSREAGTKFDDVPMWQVARATSAAPSYFKPCVITEVKDEKHPKDYYYVDGGVFANDPAKVAYLALRRDSPDRPIVLLSIGCGDARPFKPDKDDLWGALPWAERLVHLFMTAPSELVEVELKELADTGHSLEYLRLTPKLGHDASPKLDCATDKNMRALERSAKGLLDENAAALADLCKKL